MLKFNYNHICLNLIDKDYKGYWEVQGWSDYAGRDRPGQRCEISNQFLKELIELKNLSFQ